VSQALPWTCPGDRAHVLGVVVETDGGIRQLLIYREATVSRSAADLMEIGEERQSPGENEVDVISTVEGLADVRCSICGSIRTWVPSPKAIRKMIANGIK